MPALTAGIPAAVAARMSLAIHPVPAPYGAAQQFTAGRRAAARALALAGSACRVVPRQAGGRPLFPPAFAGSISHTGRLALAVVVPGASAVGCDIENAAITARMTRFVLHTPERRTLLEQAGYSARDLFAAKEAAFKALSGTAGTGRFWFWQIRLSQDGGALRAAYGGLTVPVWMSSRADLSVAVAIRH
ncbi:hypothetical protein GCM10010260_69320 [Streptomyces filipinensis]|uniref:4'-phosphopantetheinyl transferase superfamily protein n=1 Tax=Streptomyces filipinensis TaxID=66887 RepID=A0A918IHU7_9ACTN|nr:4'-phosphopantetheinyl transferase superfamily protein [Streptomyces filipinensis]GGV19585.1 hypothetical protein GCM10010260_69320 [Streptomyces filipinensis]